MFLFLNLFLINIKLKKYVTLVLFISSLTVSSPDKYITQKMCDEAVDGSLASLKFIIDWFLIRKMINELFTSFYANDGLLLFDEDSGDVTLFCDEMGSVYHNNINLDKNFDKDDPNTIIIIRLLAWQST